MEAWDLQPMKRTECMTYHGRPAKATSALLPPAAATPWRADCRVSRTYTAIYARPRPQLGKRPVRCLRHGFIAKKATLGRGHGGWRVDKRGVRGLGGRVLLERSAVGLDPFSP